MLTIVKTTTKKNRKNAITMSAMYRDPAILSKVSVAELLIIIVVFTTLWKLFCATRDWREELSHMVKHSKEIQGPPTLPIIGNSLIFMGSKGALLKQMIDCAVTPYSENLKPIRLWIGHRLMIVVRSPQDIKVVLNSRETACKGHCYRYLKPFVGDGLITGSGEKCKTIRRLFIQTMKSQFVNNYVDDFVRGGAELMSELMPLADGRVFDIFEKCNQCIENIVCQIVMGYDYDAYNNSNHRVTESIATLYEIVSERMLKIWLQPDCLFKLTAKYKKQCESRTVIRDFTEKCIAAERKNISMSKLHTKSSTNSETKAKSVLRQIIEMNDASHELTNDELSDAIFTFYLAAQDTAATATSFACLLLGIHADVQEKARREVQEVLKNGETINIKTLNRMKYMEMFVKEILRLFPIAPFAERTVTDDVQLDGYTLPKGSQMVLASYATQRSEILWRNSEKFDPERFSAEECAKRHPYAYIPFMMGSRACIGQSIAITSIKAIVANLLRSYRITTDMKMENIELKADISIRSVKGYNVSLQPISGCS